MKIRKFINKTYDRAIKIENSIEFREMRLFGRLTFDFHQTLVRVTYEKSAKNKVIRNRKSYS